MIISARNLMNQNYSNFSPDQIHVIVICPPFIDLIRLIIRKIVLTPNYNMKMKFSSVESLSSRLLNRNHFDSNINRTVSFIY